MIDIHDIIILPETERLPLDLRRGTEAASVYLEVGFGNGEYLIHLAKENPGAMLWGVEMSRSCVLRAIRRVKREQVENIRLVCGDARFFLEKCLARNSLSGIYMNFPCPWPKKRHSKKRLSGDGFPSEIAGALEGGGFFELMTDEEWFASEVRDSFADEPAFSAVDWLENPSRPVTTKYERKWTEQGKNLFRLRFLKNKGEAADDASHLSGRYEELHILIRGSGDLQGLMNSLSNLEGRRGDSLWVLKRSYSSDRETEYLIEAVCTDGGFEQKLFVMVVKRSDDVLVKVAPYSAPFLTDSVKEALKGVASAIEGHFVGLAPEPPSGESRL